VIVCTRARSTARFSLPFVCPPRDLPDLNRVAVHRDTALQELDIDDGQRYCLAPSQHGECEGQHQVGVTAGLLGQPAHILLGEIDMAFRGLLRLSRRA
jgi:hypothetical protein